MKLSQSLDHLLQGKRLLIFDFDGTVADTTPLHASAFLQVLSPLGVPLDYPAIAGMKTADALRMCLLAAGTDLPEAEIQRLAAAKQRVVRELIQRSLRPLPWAEAFLRWAQGRYRLSLATSGSRGTVETALVKLGYEAVFDPVVFGDDVHDAKPSPEIFLHVLRLTQVPPDESLVFEDSEAGFVAARAAGLEFFDVNAMARSGTLAEFRL